MLATGKRLSVERFGAAVKRSERHHAGRFANPGRLVAAVAAFLPLTMFGPAMAGEAAQEAWLVSTRSAPHCGDWEAGVERLSYWRLDTENSCRWLPANAKLFRESGDPAVPITIYIHGDHTDPDGAVRRGMSIHAQLRRCSEGRPFRLVIWSWPSDRIARRFRTDAQIKAGYTDAESYYLACCLSDIKPGTPLGLIGYSFGARTIAGGLHLLAGGQVAGRSLTPQVLARWSSGAPRRVRAMFLAAAIDADWLMPVQPEGKALLQVERLLVTRNGWDRALGFYSRMYCRRGPEAMGHAGPVCTLPPGSVCDKLEVLDVSGEVGKRHDWRVYQAAPSFVGRLAWYTFLAPAAEEQPAHK